MRERDRHDVDVNASDFHRPLSDLEFVRRIRQAVIWYIILVLVRRRSPVRSPRGLIAFGELTLRGLCGFLVTSVHGRDLNRLLAAAGAPDTGLVKIMATTGADFCAPFGGEKDSSCGPREQGPDALAFYSSTRTVTIAPHGG
jgi:hypothetical protein